MKKDLFVYTCELRGQLNMWYQQDLHQCKIADFPLPQELSLSRRDKERKRGRKTEHKRKPLSFFAWTKINKKNGESRNQI